MIIRDLRFKNNPERIITQLWKGLYLDDNLKRSVNLLEKDVWARSDMMIADTSDCG